jgi:hypothetical protein
VLVAEGERRLERDRSLRHELEFGIARGASVRSIFDTAAEKEPFEPVTGGDAGRAEVFGSSA